MAERRESSGRRWQDRIGAYIAVLLVALVVELAVLLVAQFVPVGVDATQNADINRIPLEAAYDTRLASRQGCIRANPGRVAQIQDALDRAKGNQARADAWKQMLAYPLPDPLKVAVVAQIKANELEAVAAREYAHILIAAQHEVAKHPNAADVADRVAVDCREVYPIGERGAPLPEPTKP